MVHFRENHIEKNNYYDIMIKKNVIIDYKIYKVKSLFFTREEI